MSPKETDKKTNKTEEEKNDAVVEADADAGESNNEDSDQKNNDSSDAENEKKSSRKKGLLIAGTGLTLAALLGLLGYRAMKSKNNGDVDNSNVASIVDEEDENEEDEEEKSKESENDKEQKIDEEDKNSETSDDKKEEEGGFWGNLFAEEKIQKPSFDIVRMEKGDAVIAGRGEPEREVYIIDNGKEIGKEEIDENGEWVFLPKKSLEPGEHNLSLYIENDNGEKVKSEQDAVLYVPKPGEKDDSVAVAMGGEKDSRILHAPKGEDIGDLRVSKIQASEVGSVRVDGYGKDNHKIRLYLNNKYVGEKSVHNKTNKWFIRFDQKLEEKSYDLRADMLNSKGKVISRVEYSFTPKLYKGEKELYVIKLGDNLWNIAKKNYGSGFDYVIIFKANKEQIKDPDLIYPKQVIVIPEQREADIEKE